MISVLSPAKTLDMESPACVKTFTQPDFVEDSAELIELLRGKSEAEIGKLMGISEKLAALNAERYQVWDRTFTEANAKQALLAFRGDVYTGMDADSFSAKDFDYAQKHVRILSGLYGMLRPLDLMQAYRLEMGTRLETERGRNLYDFWGNDITEGLNRDLAASKTKLLLNLASQEYFKAVRPAGLDAEVITPVFKDEKKGTFKIISFYAKKARGMMAAFQVKNRIEKIDDLKAFDTAGYYYVEDESSERELVFYRDEQ